ncbi:hypothetical protein HOP50_02g11410 [Chloropicon primus]|uniref:Fibronectin type-II domain-containing protein n=1 Tax=Chloropicon primus TaxID=1764295 RepID=A0A5B8ME27_9CHLO|nr:hypothetical protein A3770_02p11550 [Chloropicon primus]UPQ97846.1 hypothetical protein HOP50_02g11410 [Chloropicon primus]|mmetsp:Transcript_10735/g.30231  ORF Transcript_10735/g.30231 Transcript_10735/m.30231 type:complete len:394 (+) Transcript_10735:79-1260(+)|eukprot:QDZ18637.1 hypothetical protein A3770_02p11550 [Chloropicon primus]
MHFSKFAVAAAALVAAASAPLAVVVEGATHPQDLAALAKFKEEALKMSNNDARWRKVFETWVGDDPCGADWHGEWHGVQCRELQGVKQWTLPDNVYRRVTNMHIPEWGLPGHLPESLCLFEMLEELDFDENEFEGTLPACVGCLPHLREIDIEDNKFTGTIPREWGNLKNLVEFEIDGNELLAGCIPEGLPKDAEWCGDCWSTCPSYDPYCGSYDCKSCVSWTKDPEIGTSYENTRIKGERCPNEPNPPVCPWEIFKEEFEAQQAEQEEQRKQRALEAQRRFQEEEKESLTVRSVEADPSTGTFLIEAQKEAEPEPEVEVEVEPAAPEKEEAEPASPGAAACGDAKPRLTIDNEECVFPFTVMDQVHCDCIEHDNDSWCTVADGTWKKCAPDN